MWGWQVRELGDPADALTWTEIPDPEPGPGQVLVRVAAVACNFPDILLCQGKYQEKPALPFTPGWRSPARSSRPVRERRRRSATG